MDTETHTEEYLTAIDYDENGEILSAVVMVHNWVDVFNYKLNNK